MINIHEEPTTSLVLIINFKKCFKHFKLEMFKECMQRETDFPFIYM